MTSIKIDSVIERQIAYCLKAYGDEPKELIWKLQQLVIEWHCKGISIGIETERSAASDSGRNRPIQP